MVFFPNSLDFFPFRRTREQHNAAASTNRITSEDVLYILNELEKKVGTNNSSDSGSLDGRLSAVEDQLGELKAQINGGSPVASIPSFPFRANRTAASAGGTFVRFSVPIRAGYILLAACYNAAGQVTGYSISNQTSEGFTVTPLEDATFEWVAVSAL